MVKEKKVFQKIVYALIFSVVIPIIMIIWSWQLDKFIQLKSLHFPIIGIVLSLIGILMILLAVIHLYQYGNGLPMNAFPPEKFVSKGIYSVFSHPIYFGFALLSIGVSVYFGSPSGLWIVSPIAIIAMIVLVIAYENPIMKKLYGKQITPAKFSLAPDSDNPATVWNKVSALFLVFALWGILYEIFIFMGISPYSIVSNFPFEFKIPVVEFMEIAYLTVYPLAIISPFLIKKQSTLRDFVISGFLAIGLGIFIFLTVPFIAVPRPFIPQTYWGHLIVIERGLDGATSAFPSYHVIWIWFVAYYLSKELPKIQGIFWFLAVAVTLSCVLIGVHSIIDLISGIIVFLISVNRKKVWQYLQKESERIANSWHDWDFGFIRVINHGFYAAIGVFIGMALVMFILGREFAEPVLIVGFSNLICAGLWAQFIEGSPKLLRPFGYYGGVIGTILGGIIVAIFYQMNLFLLIGTFALAAPWIQLMGRFRCLVQGCCHGAICNEKIGIRYFHEKSRVLKIADLKGEFIHPTPLYSIISNVFIGIFLLGLQYQEMPLNFIAGMYLILAGFARFLEESFRGEPQTPIYLGLHAYHWLSLISIILGIIFTILPNLNYTTQYDFSYTTLLVPFILALAVNFALGVDFPKSNKRFSRLV